MKEMIEVLTKTLDPCKQGLSIIEIHQLQRLIETTTKGRERILDKEIELCKLQLQLKG